MILGHFYFSQWLLERIYRSDDGRIVMVLSSAHFTYYINNMTFKDLESVNQNRAYLRRYVLNVFPIILKLGQSKLATILYIRELAKRIPY